MYLTLQVGIYPLSDKQLSNNWLKMIMMITSSIHI